MQLDIEPEASGLSTHSYRVLNSSLVNFAPLHVAVGSSELLTGIEEYVPSTGKQSDVVPTEITTLSRRGLTATYFKWNGLFYEQTDVLV